MKVMYLLEINDPNGVGPLPPYILFSDWGQWFRTELPNRAYIKYNGNFFSFMVTFDSTDELFAWIESIEIKDEIMREDIILWQNENGITVKESWYHTTDNIDHPRAKLLLEPTDELVAEIHQRRSQASA